MSPVAKFYRNAIAHCHSMRQYNKILAMIRTAKAIDDDDYRKLLKVTPMSELSLFERLRNVALNGM